jgi:ABC-type transport system involved in multi-copper enzyme maturation permease subunit
MTERRPVRGGHWGRIVALSLNTFTQLVRMKVFYFLMVFALIMLGSNFFDLPQHSLPETFGFGVLRAIMSWSLGAMTLFSMVMAIVATALLLPRDVEDRTLYTILAKPVPRIDYLAGKLFGVLLLLAVALLVMDLLMLAVLQVRVGMFEGQLDAMIAAGHAGDEIGRMRASLRANAPGWSLQGAVVAVFLRAAVMTALTLFISTFSTSTLFTSIVSFLVYFLGYFQADLRAVFLHGSGVGMLERGGALVVSLLLPDFQLFNVIDAVIEGGAMPPAVIGRLAVMGGFHVAIYLTAAWYVFADKEV